MIPTTYEKQPKIKEQETEQTPKSFRDKAVSWLIAIACLSCFFLIYWIGKTIVQWLN
ncbi:MAG: hypothetical protein R2824_20470 [Saprospiraceae bacterium]|nr:hypothetical protein [Lewinella sp.]